MQNPYRLESLFHLFILHTAYLLQVTEKLKPIAADFRARGGAHPGLVANSSQG